MPLPKTCCSTALFTTEYKRLAKGCEAFSFLMKGGFLDVGGFLGEKRPLEGRIAGGGLLKGKGLLKENC
jgi:hypothetical protein